MPTVSWAAGTSGNWATGSNWTGGAKPNSADAVSISVAGTYTVTVAAAATASSLAIYNPTATLDLEANLTLGHGFTDTQSLVDVAAGTLAVSAGALTLGTNSYAYDASFGATLDGPGVFATGAKTTTSIVSGPVSQPLSPYWELRMGGGITWNNSGTVLDSGAILVGDGSGGDATINNAAGATFEFLSPYSNIWLSSGASASFVNAGKIVENFGGGTTNFGAALTNTGVVDLQSGTLDLGASSMLGGTLTGSGVLEFGAGASTVTGSVESNLLIAGGAVVLASAAAIAGNISETTGSLAIDASGPSVETVAAALSDTQGSIELAGGTTLTVTGPTVTFGTNNYAYNASYGATVDGSGIFDTSTTVTTTIVSGPVSQPLSPYWELLLGGGVVWNNAGTVLDSGAILAGDASGASATINNQAGGIFEFLSPYSNVWLNNGASAIFNNAGTLIENTAENGAIYCYASLNNTGLLDLQSGTLTLEAASMIGGTLTGAGVLDVANGATTLTAATSGNLLVTGGELILAQTVAITGNVSETTGAIILAASGPGGVTLDAALSDTQGNISIAAGKNFTVAGAGTIFGTNNYAYNASFGATIDGPGTFTTGGDCTVTIVSGPVSQPLSPYWELRLGGGVQWNNSGTVLDSGAILIGDGSGGNVTITNEAGGVFQFLSPYSNLWIANGGSGNFVNNGTITEDNGNGAVTNFGATLNNTGAIDLQSGTLDLTAGGIIGGNITGVVGLLQFGGGDFNVNAAVSANLLVTAGVVTLATTATIAGNLTDDGGTVGLTKNVALSGVVIDQAGLVEITGGTLTGSAVTIDGGAMLSGYGTISALLINNGTVTASGGLLAVAAGDSGAGTCALSGASKLEFLGSTAVSTIDFLQGGAETLELAKPGSVSGSISGFGATDTIDLLKTIATGLAYSNGALTISGASGTIAVLDFGGQYTLGDFALQSDGASGTDIVFNTAGAVPPAQAGVYPADLVAFHGTHY